MTTPNNRYQLLQQVREAGLAEEKDYLSVARLIAESLRVREFPQTEVAR